MIKIYTVYDQVAFEKVKHKSFSTEQKAKNYIVDYKKREPKYYMNFYIQEESIE